MVETKKENKENKEKNTKPVMITDNNKIQLNMLYQSIVIAQANHEKAQSDFRAKMFEIMAGMAISPFEYDLEQAQGIGWLFVRKSSPANSDKSDVSDKSSSEEQKLKSVEVKKESISRPIKAGKRGRKKFSNVRANLEKTEQEQDKDLTETIN